MYLKAKFICTIFVLLSITSCRKFDVGDSFRLPFGKSAIVQSQKQQLIIKFTDLIEDSSYPKNSRCIWAGRTVVEIEINQNTTAILAIGDLTTGTNEPLKNSVSFKGHLITLESATYKREWQHGKKEKYAIILHVEE